MATSSSRSQLAACFTASHCRSRTRRFAVEPSVRARRFYLDSTGTNPEAFGPFGAGGYGLQVGVLAFVLQVDCTGDAGHRLEANKVPGLSFRRGRLPNDGHRILGAEKCLDFLPVRLN